MSQHYIYYVGTADCGVPPQPANGKVTLQDGTSTLGSLASQVCHLGHDLSGTTTIECLETGWSSGPVNCSLKGIRIFKIYSRRIKTMTQYDVWS